MVEKVGDEAWWLHHVIGPWDMAAEIRGLVDLSMDIYDRPQFVHDLMRFCTDWLKGFYRRLGETGIHSISMNETWVGVGVAPDHFLEFMKPYETECVQAAHDAGYLVSFHNCGRATLLLEDMADTGPDAIETLTSSRSSGDVDLADAKQRIGDRVCLFGGFNEHLLHEADADARPRRGQALPRRGDGGRRLRPPLDRTDLRREARADRGHVRDRPRARPVQLTTSADLFDVETAADGPVGAAAADAGVPARPAVRATSSGCPRTPAWAGSRRRPARDPFLILSTQGGRARRRRHARSRSATTRATGRWGCSCARRRVELDRLGGLPFAAHVSDPCDGRTQGTTGHVRLARRTGTTPRSCCAGSSAACRRGGA